MTQPALPLTLDRLADTGVQTFGKIFDAEENEICVTLERPWKNNLPNISCIPAGTYKIEKRFSPEHHMDVFWVNGVPDREDIELHIGNFSKDTKGCILLGTSYEDFGKADGDIANSEVAFNHFMYLMKDVDTTMLTIIAAPELAEAA